ncbi:MAG: ComEC/Rec2 family competence protein [Bacteroidaceae bacterium]|nr:ComEC/Rec2 family competence protein [Bacteroidaceae bacterium]MBQ9642339.1 ComEC/Rec2 family competence protein [Bacteroidaceae bacterium]
MPPLKWLVVTAGVCICFNIIYNSLLSRQPDKYKPHIFYILTALTFFLFGLILSCRSHRQALERYGEEWKYEIYKNNDWQNERAAELQRWLHERFTAVPSEKDGFCWQNHPDECAVVEAMTTGWRRGLTKEIKQTYRMAGISHVLALSGYHVGLIFLALLWVFRLFGGSLAWRRAGYVLILFILWGYALVTGMSPSIVRATLMCSVVTLLKLLERDAELMNVCIVAAFLMLAANPLLIGHVGFQLSFCSVAGIALMGRWIPWSYFLGGLMVSFVCTVATGPLVAYHFGAVPVYGLLTNVYASLLVPPILVLTAVWWLLVAVGWVVGVWILPLAGGVAMALCRVAWLLNKIAEGVSGLPFATVETRLSVVEVVGWYGVILAAVSLCYRVTGRRIIVLQVLLIGTLFSTVARKMGLGFGLFGE